MAMMGIGEGEGESRAGEAAHMAISSPLLEDIDISGAKGVLVNITGSSTMTMDEFDEASRVIHEKVHEDANIIIGLVINEEMGDRLQITAIATGFGESFDQEEGLDSRVRPMNKVDRDVPTFLRDRQKEARRGLGAAVEEDSYEIPTFMRKRVD